MPEGQSVNWYIDRVHTITKLEGIELTTKAFDKFIKGFGSIFITIAVFFFAFSTLITWSYYGETAAGNLLGNWVVKPYKWFFIVFIYIGAVKNLTIILNFTDLMVGLLVIPNTIAILLLSPKVHQWSVDYFKKLKTGEIKPYH